MTFGVLLLLGKLLLFRGMGRGYNQTDPAALLRHNSPLYLIYAALYLTVSTLLAVFAVCPECSDTASRKKELTLLLALAILVIGLFRSANPSVVEQMTLQWVSGLNLRLSDAYGTESVLFWTIQTAEIVLALGAVVGIYAFFSAREKGVVRPFLLFLLIPVLVSGFLGHSSIGVTYTEHLAPYDSVGRISDFFEQTEDNVLYLSDTYWQFHHAKAWNCRYEPVERSYYLIFSEYNDRSGSTETVESGTDDPAAGTRVGDIAFCGVIDEGQYIIPNGMAYNSHVILDEKTAVTDTTEGQFINDWLDNLACALEGRTPDYLIVHHMEPDHSAAIREFMGAYPEAVIVASSTAFPMMRNFCGTDFPDRRIVVRDGDTLALGKHILTFFTAPMVHWPEVIMSYDSADKVLFSADAFGKFGALDVPDDDWACEARRYYFGIVGKFGVQVQSLLKKLSGLDTFPCLITESAGIGSLLTGSMPCRISSM